MKALSLFLCFNVFFCSYAQGDMDSLTVDNRFFEDQFYFGINYNFLIDEPEDVNQQNLSYGLQMGFIKDMALSANRKWALGVGLGYAVNSYYSNLGAVYSDSSISYSVLDDDVLLNGEEGYNRNKLESHLLELPVELRWRNATASEYKFWRIHAGVKLGYAFGTRSKLVSDVYKDSFYNKDAANFLYDLTFSVGYNTFNLHAHYTLNNLFNDGVTLNGDQINTKALHIGLIFYIL